MSWPVPPPLAAGVLIGAAVEGVVAGTPEQRVVSGEALENVVAKVAVQAVDEPVSRQRVVLDRPVEVFDGVGDERVVPVTAGRAEARQACCNARRGQLVADGRHGLWFKWCSH